MRACVPVWVYVYYMSAGAAAGQRVVRSQRMAVTGGSEPPDMGSGN